MISVIIPVHNSEKILSHGLDSVLSQSYQDFEVLLVENGSTDNTYEICKEYEKKDGRVRAFSIGPCNGPSKARNYGLDNAIGEYIVFIDAGDPIEQGYFEDLIEAFKEADVVFSGYITKSPEGVRTGEVIPVSLGEEQKLLCYSLYRQDCFGYTTVKALKKEVVQGVRFDESLNLFEDELFTLEALDKELKIAVISKAYYHYEITEDALTRITHNDMIEKKEKSYLAWKKFLNGYNKETLSIARAYVSFCLNYIYDRNLDKKSSIDTLKSTTFYKDLIQGGEKVSCTKFFAKRKIASMLRGNR